MLEARRWPSLLWGLGVIGVTGGLRTPAWLPAWAWVGFCVAGLALAFLGSSVRTEGGPWVRRGLWMMAAGCVWQTLLQGGVLVSVALRLTTPIWFWLGMLAMIPCLFVFVEAAASLQGRPIPRWAVPRDPPPLGTRASVWAVAGVDQLLAIMLCALFALGGLWLAWAVPERTHFGLGSSLFFGSGVPVLARQVMIRWWGRTEPRRRLPRWPRPLGVVMLTGGSGLLAAAPEVQIPVFFRALFAALFTGLLAWMVWRGLSRLFGRGAPRVWFAREGLVEETPDGKLLFPWIRISRIDLTEIHGTPFVLVWFRDEDVPFQVIDLSVPDDEREQWMRRRAAALRQNVASNGAPLVLGEAVLESSPFAAHEQMRQIASDQASLHDLPSVLDDPPDVDLKGLGIG